MSLGFPKIFAGASAVFFACLVTGLPAACSSQCPLQACVSTGIYRLQLNPTLMNGSHYNLILNGEVIDEFDFDGEVFSPCGGAAGCPEFRPSGPAVFYRDETTIAFVISVFGGDSPLPTVLKVELQKDGLTTQIGTASPDYRETDDGCSGTCYEADVTISMVPVGQ